MNTKEVSIVDNASERCNGLVFDAVILQNGNMDAAYVEVLFNKHLKQ